MKKAYWKGYLLSLSLCAIGIFFRDLLNIMDKVLVCVGSALFLAVFVRHCVRNAPRCPNCSAILYSGHLRTIAGQKDGMVPCEKCGTLVRVEHFK